MKACDIELNIDEVMSKVSPSLAKKIEYSIDLIRKSEKMALRLDPENGFHNTFSGGKDSQVLYHLVKLSGMKDYEYCPLFPIEERELHDFVVSKRPTLRNKNFRIEF